MSLTRFKMLLGLVLLSVSLSAPGCGGERENPTKAQVAVSVEPHAWLVRQIAGPDLSVVTVVPSGESPATYQPTDAQVTEVMRSRAYFRTGVPFESGGWFRGLASVKPLQIIDLRDGLTLREMADHRHHGHGHDHHDHHDHHEHHAHTDDDHAGMDPHIWLDPILLKKQAATITDALSEHFPEQAATYRANLEAFEKSMDELDARVRRQLASHEGPGFFVFHPAWGYFADRYGLDQWPVEIDGKDPSEAELSRLIEKARQERARVLFVQPQFKSGVIDELADAAGLDVRTLDPLAPDISQTLETAAQAIAESHE